MNSRFYSTLSVLQLSLPWTAWNDLRNRVLKGTGNFILKSCQLRTLWTQPPTSIPKERGSFLFHRSSPRLYWFSRDPAVLKAERRNRRRRRCGTTVQWCQIRAALHRTTDSGGIRTQKASDVRVSTVFRVPSYSRRIQTYYLLFYSLTPCDWQPESLRIFESHFIIRV